LEGHKVGHVKEDYCGSAMGGLFEVMQLKKLVINLSFAAIYHQAETKEKRRYPRPKPRALFLFKNNLEHRSLAVFCSDGAKRRIVWVFHRLPGFLAVFKRLRIAELPIIL